MYLKALVTRWRNKDVRFTIENPSLDSFELTALLLSKGKYLSILCNDIDEGCKVLDAGLNKEFNDHCNINTGKK